MTNPTCKDCPDRHPICHDSCPRYAEYKRQLKAQRIYTNGNHAAERISRKGADKYHDLVTEMLETAIRRVGNEYADMLFEYDQQRREAEKQCEQLAMEGMVKK